jgi:glycosyltransferase involved in cell wall biosynthesis
MKRILMLTELPINNFGVESLAKTAGNQTLYNTLKGYSTCGFNVIVMSFCKVPKGQDKPFPNVEIRQAKFFMLFTILKKLKYWILEISNMKVTENPKITTNIRRVGSPILFRFCKFFGCVESLIISLKFKPDMIYGYEIYSTSPAYQLSRIIKKPVVSRFQGTELAFFLDDDQRFYEAKCYVKGTQVPADLIIMANDGTRGDEVLRKLGVDEAKTRFWINGLNDKAKYINYPKDPAYKRKLNLPEGAYVLCTANRFVDWKRVDRIIRVTNYLTKKNPKVYLYAIGGGLMREELEKLTDSLNIKENVIFAGVLEHEDTIYHIANADIVITLNDGGNLGNSILEALALGSAVCTIKNDSVERVLQDGYNAILVDSIDEKTIADRIYDFMSNKDKLTALQVNARNYAAENLLSWPERMRLEVDAISKLIESDKF